MFRTLIHRIFLIISLCLLHSWSAQADVVLWSQGTTHYDILVGKEASGSERTAAKELAFYLEQVSGVKFMVLEVATQHDVEQGTPNGRRAKKHICVGHLACKLVWNDCKRYAPDDEGFEIAEHDGHLLINGGLRRGTMYGVFTLLDEQVGVHWYTPSYTHVPHRASCTVKPTGSFAPRVFYRYDYGYDAIRNEVWCARNRMNMLPSPATNEYGGMESYWGAHTFEKLLPAAEYFKQHPEYYSLRNRKRIDNGQLCLSNPDVLPLVTERLRRYMKANPQFWGYDVSQNDNQLYCECRRCTALAKRYGGQSGLMLWFVNQVARAVKDEYPDKLIGTFAYQYTRHAPRGIRPADNVVIRLCDIECCFLHPLDGCAENQRFLDDMKAWNRLTDKIFIWDYVVNFHFYHVPLPNHGVVGRNIQLLLEHGATGILELGAYDAVWSDFSEMRQWVMAQLLWDPSQNADSLAVQFIDDYYTVSAAEIKAYYQLLRQLPTPNVHFGCHSEPVASLYTPHFRQEAQRLLEAAASKAEQSGDLATLVRVQRLLVQAYTTNSLFDKTKSATDGTVLRLKRLIDADPTTMRERGQNINQFLRLHGYI